MARLFYAKISSVQYQKGTADVALPERENQVLKGIPFLSNYYEMPEPGDLVAAIIEEEDGQPGKGVILGKLYTSGNTPKESGAEIFYKEFTDGTYVKYTPAEQTLETSAKKVKADELTVNKLTVEDVVYGNMTRR